MTQLLKPALLLLCISFAFITHSQQPAVQKTPTGISIPCNNFTTELQVYNTGTIRVKKYPKDKTFYPQSLSVITKPASIPFSTKTKGNIVTLKTSELSVSLDASTGTLLFTSSNGTNLLKEQPGTNRFTTFNDAGQPTLSVQQGFLLDTDEAIY